jgi:ribosome maturation factor RimP
MDPDGRYARVLLPHIDGLGYDLVQIKLHSSQGKRGPLLQILAEPKEHRRMGVEDCRTLSKTLSAILDVEDMFKGAFTLEVSSPGIDRPLTRLSDFERFKGFDAKITIDPAAENGQKRFSGHLEGVIENEDGAQTVVSLQSDDGESLSFDYQRIAQAKLVYSDELMTASKDKVL